MDHLPIPIDNRSLGIIAPCLPSGALDYDGMELEDYPVRRGLTPEGESFDVQHLHGEPEEDAMYFVQEWLFFGLLHEIFGSLYQRSDFLQACEDSPTGLKVSTALLEDKWEALGHSFEPIRGWRHMSENVERYENSLAASNRIPLLLRYATKQAHDLDQPRSSPYWPAIILSIRLLIEKLRELALNNLGTSKDDDLDVNNRVESWKNPSALAIGNVILEEREWCIHQYQRLCQHVSLSTLHYVASMRRYAKPSVDHRRCKFGSKCVAYNLDNNINGVAHAQEDCNCDNVYAPADQMTSILKEGGIPLLQYSENEGHIELNYVKASPYIDYVAISHLWADGLGNNAGNFLPRCQLEKLVQDVKDVNNRHPNETTFWSPTAPHELLQIYLQRNNHGNAKSNRRKGQAVIFWLDVYCVPKSAPRADVLRSPVFDQARQVGAASAGILRSSVLKQAHQAEGNMKDMETAALNRMAATYAWAKYVLVNDSELSYTTEAHEKSEIAARVAVSGWNSRAWTYQEMSLANQLVFRCVSQSNG